MLFKEAKEYLNNNGYILVEDTEDYLETIKQFAISVNKVVMDKGLAIYWEDNVSNEAEINLGGYAICTGDKFEDDLDEWIYRLSNETIDPNDLGLCVYLGTDSDYLDYSKAVFGELDYEPEAGTYFKEFNTINDLKKFISEN